MAATSHEEIPAWLLAEIYGETDTSYDFTMAQRLQNELNLEADKEYLFRQTPTRHIMPAPIKSIEPTYEDLERTRLMREQEEIFERMVEDDNRRKQEEQLEIQRKAMPVFEFDVTNAPPEQIYTIRFRFPDGRIENPLQIHKREKLEKLFQFVRHRLQFSGELIMRLPRSPPIVEISDILLQDVSDITSRCLINISLGSE